MAYGKTRRTTGLRGTTGVRRSIRKKRSTATKVRYQRPTARNQQSQIASNAMDISRNRRAINRHKVYTDYQYTDLVPLSAPGWGVVELTNFSNWNPVLRRSEDVLAASHTFIKRMQINIRASLNDAEWAAFNVFVVTLRRDAAGKDPFTTAPVITEEWIEPSQLQGFNIRLNSAFVGRQKNRKL